jgi:hypothetical protein
MKRKFHVGIAGSALLLGCLLASAQQPSNNSPKNKMMQNYHSSMQKMMAENSQTRKQMVAELLAER